MKKLFRKIHLWLSVPFGIFITLICFSGSMLVFEKEITMLCRHDLYFVEEVKEHPLALDSLMKCVSATLPDSVSATGVTISPDAELAYQVNLSRPRRASVFVDQYTGEIKGRSERLPFFDTMFHLHRWLLGASQSKDGGMSAGKLLVGISTLMLVIILITGLLMWLTNRHKPLRKSLTISFTKGWPRFWHDLHVAGGIYATIFLLALALTGLTWSFSWYRSGFYGMFGVEAGANEHGRSHGGGHGERGNGGRDNRQLAQEGYHQQAQEDNDRHERHHRPDTLYAQEERADSGTEDMYEHHGHGGREASDAPRHRRGGRGGRNGHGHRGHGDRPHSPRQEAFQEPDMELGHDSVTAPALPEPSPFACWDEVYNYLVKNNPDYRQITISDGSASVVPAGRNSLRSGDTFDFNPENGVITGNTPYSAQDKSAKVRSTIYTVHVGSWGGLFTRILTFLAALLGATLPLTGYYLWIKRLRNKSTHKHPKS